jgi:tRNA(Arg) A34 adenosine deaminase TadA
MCSGALYWSGIGRLVYGLSKKRATEVEREKDAGPQLLLDCRVVFVAGERTIRVERPALEDEAELLLRE